MALNTKQNMDARSVEEVRTVVNGLRLRVSQHMRMVQHFCTSAKYVELTGTSTCDCNPDFGRKSKEPISFVF